MHKGVCVCVCVCVCGTIHIIFNAHTHPTHILALTHPTLTDKSPQLMDFVAQIKANADTAQLFESIQHDATITIPTPTGGGVESMDVS